MTVRDADERHRAAMIRIQQLMDRVGWSVGFRKGREEYRQISVATLKEIARVAMSEAAALEEGEA